MDAGEDKGISSTAESILDIDRMVHWQDCGFISKRSLREWWSLAAEHDISESCGSTSVVDDDVYEFLCRLFWNVE